MEKIFTICGNSLRSAIDPPTISVRVWIGHSNELENIEPLKVGENILSYANLEYSWHSKNKN